MNSFIYKWAPWIGLYYHICRCSNHTEEAHANINGSIESLGSSNFSTGLSVIINYIFNVFQNRKTAFKGEKANNSKIEFHINSKKCK